MDNKAYDDFEPFCKWQTDTTCDILKIYLQGFQKEQLKIEMNNKNEMTITGERRDEISNRMRRFGKEIRISSKEYNVNEIEANFEADCLSITMPRKVRLNTILADQVLNLKHILRRPKINKNGINMPVIVAISLGMALGVFLAFKRSKHSAEPPPETNIISA